MGLKKKLMEFFGDDIEDDDDDDDDNDDDDGDNYIVPGPGDPNNSNS